VSVVGSMVVNRGMVVPPSFWGDYMEIFQYIEYIPIAHGLFACTASGSGKLIRIKHD
jgi:hypothetical protein